MAIDRENHKKRIKEAIEELTPLSDAYGEPAPVTIQYLGTVVDNTLGLLVSALIGMDGQPRRFYFENDSAWLSFMQSVHRSFFASTLLAVEAALDDVCKRNGWEIKSQSQEKATRLARNLSHKLTDADQKKIRELAPRHPTFSDALESVLKQMTWERELKKRWRKYFRALTIMRNKSAHFAQPLTLAERQDLRAGGFGAAIGNGYVVANPRMFRQVCDHISEFLGLIYGSSQAA